MARGHLFFLYTLLGLGIASAYEVAVQSTDYSRQICSGMYANQATYINVTFDAMSQGHLAMVIYEWADAPYLGKVTSQTDDTLPKTYVCTSNAMAAGFCGKADLGRFILDLPTGTSVNDTSFWSARVELSSDSKSSDSTSAFWNNPAGNPAPPPGEYPPTPWLRARHKSSDSVPALWDNTAWNPRLQPGGLPKHARDLGSLPVVPRQDHKAGANTSPNSIYKYQYPIQYNVRKTGYYCVAIVPVTTQGAVTRQTPGDVHPSYKGVVFFRNAFDGKLPATDYPKVNFYLALLIVYTVLGAAWGILCYRHLQELLPIQYYLSSLIGLLIIEMVANLAYYRYLNAHGRGTVATVFLFVVAILDAGRNALSFFMLLVVSLGLSVVRESLGRTMLKCQLLAGAHFVFGVLYAVGIVELELESTSAFVLLLFVIPLAFTLSGFLLWIMYSLSATTIQLRVRKQRYKLSMFSTLYRILLLTVVVIAIFFVVSSFSFSGRLAEDYAAKSWKIRWWLLDGWLALLYLVAFTAIAFLWRPSANNRRLAMSDEIAQDEEDAEDYDLEALELRTHARDEEEDDAATLVGERRTGPPGEDVVFEIGDEDADSDNEDLDAKKRRTARHSGEHPNGHEDERQGLMGGDQNPRGRIDN